MLRHMVSLLALTACVSVARGQTDETVRVDLKLRTGGSLSGLVVEHTNHGLVIVHETTPYVFAWIQLEPGSAYGTRRALRAFERGGEEKLSAGDHFELGVFTLAQGRRDLAAKEFRLATRLDPDLEPLIKDAVEESRRRQGLSETDHLIEEEAPSTVSLEAAADVSLPDRVDAGLADSMDTAVAPIPSRSQRARVLAVYKTFGAKVQKVLGRSVVLVETDHFLIWTDWAPRDRDRLAAWCERMYAVLSEQFELDPAEQVFLAKCPVFCWRSKQRFRRFARHFDGHDGTEALGYTRSIEKSGHVHLVLLRQGRSEADFDRFACTLVHEGTHAFLHRLFSSRLIPHWINEGCADLMAERVLGDRCPAGENAELLARPFVRYNWSIAELLHRLGPIEMHQYPLAHSVIAYLEGLGKKRFAGFIKSLKAGVAVSEALAAHYDDLTLDQLEARWRASVRASWPPPPQAPILPWATGR